MFNRFVSWALIVVYERGGTGLRAVQWAADGVVEALCHRRLPVWGVQWHPERLSPAGRDLLGAFLALCG